jgi:acyl-coenzyme A thioesterase PaaI-like protein
MDESTDTTNDAIGRTPALQDAYAPRGACFGCGPANDRGLRIKSRVAGDEVVATFQAEKHHEAFDGCISGGIIGTLLDCHSNWAATHHLMQLSGTDAPPCTVTAEYNVTFHRPTPSAAPVLLRARTVSATADRATVESTLEASGKVCATFRGTFVAVQPGHPAYHRW